MQRQRHPKQHEEPTADFIEPPPRASQPWPHPVRGAGHQVFDHKLHHGVGQRDDGGLRDDVSVGVQEGWDNRGEQQQRLGI